MIDNNVFLNSKVTSYKKINKIKKQKSKAQYILSVQYNLNHSHNYVLTCPLCILLDDDDDDNGVCVCVLGGGGRGGGGESNRTSHAKLLMDN